jgi:superoxide dismutase, Fe-Mn family
MENDFGRREFLKTAAVAGAVVTLGGVKDMLFAEAPLAVWTPPKDVAMVKLPYADNALAPAISARTVDLHYNKHHQSYYTMLKGWIGVHPEFQNQTL